LNLRKRSNLTKGVSQFRFQVGVGEAEEEGEEGVGHLVMVVEQVMRVEVGFEEVSEVVVQIDKIDKIDKVDKVDRDRTDKDRIDMVVKA